MDLLAAHASDSDAYFAQRFFKTGKGEYGEGDVFVGVRVPDTRKVCKQFRNLPLSEVKILIQSPIHEHRLGAVIILNEQFKTADKTKQKDIYDLYMEGLDKGSVNNWDIIDTSAEYIPGAYLKNKDKKILFDLAKSDNLWKRRVAIMSTFGYIKSGDASLTLELAEVLVHDDMDLIQKAVGWMLREVGKRVDEELLKTFLDQYATTMPRTMLRYSIEKLSTQQRQFYMKK